MKLTKRIKLESSEIQCAQNFVKICCAISIVSITLWIASFILMMVFFPNKDSLLTIFKTTITLWDWKLLSMGMFFLPLIFLWPVVMRGTGWIYTARSKELVNVNEKTSHEPVLLRGVYRENDGGFLLVLELD